MKRIVLISGSTRMLAQPAPARYLYTGKLFSLSLSFAEQIEPDVIYILSPSSGLIGLDDVVAPDTESINVMPAEALRTWATSVLAQLSGVASLSKDHFILLAGKPAWRYIVPHLASYSIPLDGLRTADRIEFLSWLTSVQRGFDSRHGRYYH